MEIDSLISFTRRNKIMDQLKKNTIALAMEKLHKEADVYPSPTAPRKVLFFLGTSNFHMPVPPVEVDA